MGKQSKSLKDTVLWKVYKERMSAEIDRIGWVEKVYQTSADYLKDIRQIFKNYTLHDEKDTIHIYNVIYKQVCFVSKRYGLNIRDMPQLAMSDFWMDEQENE